jgi:hypothetical protein
MAYPHGEERTPESYRVKDDQKTYSMMSRNHQPCNEKQPAVAAAGAAEHP